MKTTNKLNIKSELSTNPNIKIVLDSNIFLNYLWLSHDEFKVFLNTIKTYTKEIVFTQQTIEELNRNLPNNFEKNKQNKLSGCEINFGAEKLKFVSSTDKSTINKAKEIIEKNKKNQESAYNSNFKLLNDFLEKDLKKYTIIPRNDQVVNLAIKRKFIGNPPWSKDKNTVGDEIIWESLIAYNKNDIVIVTGDNGFLQNKDFLTKEYKQNTDYNLIDIYDELDLTTAIKDIDANNGDSKLDELKVIENNEKLSLKAKFYKTMELESINYYKYLRNVLAHNLDLSTIRELLMQQEKYKKTLEPALNSMYSSIERQRKLQQILNTYKLGDITAQIQKALGQLDDKENDSQDDK